MLTTKRNWNNNENNQIYYEDFYTPSLNVERDLCVNERENNKERPEIVGLTGVLPSLFTSKPFKILQTWQQQNMCNWQREEDRYLLEITNQSNIARINSKDDDDDEDDDEEKEIEYSKIYVKERSSNHIYLLQFQPTDIKLIPVYLKHRTFEDNINDKCIQPKSSSTYANIYNNKARRFAQLIRTYKIDNSKKEGKLSIMSFKKPLFKKKPVFPQDPKPKPTISDPVSNLKQSIIYLPYNNMDFIIKPGLMNLKSSTPIDFDAEVERESLLKSLNMELPKDMKNKGHVVVKYKGDILKFIFTLSDINCSKLKVSSSIGIMARDENIYVKEFSSISNRKIHIGVPKSNYEYIDPMIKRRQNNRTMKFNNMDPYWLDQQRKKRNKEYLQCRRKNPYDDILELKVGSSICYESLHCLNKLKGGTLPCDVQNDLYEKWVEGIQRRPPPVFDDNFVEQVPSTFSKDVPDWDLVLNSK